MQQWASDAAEAAGTAQRQEAGQQPAAALAAVSRPSSTRSSEMDSAEAAMRRELKVAGVTKPAASVLAHMHVPLRMLLRKDVAWAVKSLASKGVVLSGMEEEQLELAITPDAVGLTPADPSVPRSVHTAIEQAPPAPKPFYYNACATAMVSVALVGMVAKPMPTTKRMLAEVLCGFGHVSGRVCRRSRTGTLWIS